MNHDERLIRKAIESMPVETARSLAMGWCLVAITTAYGPLVADQFWPSPAGWIVGVFAGACLGVAISYVVSTHIRPHQRDGYEVLDDVIRGAAIGAYSARRLRASTDLLPYGVLSSLWGLADAAVRALAGQTSECQAWGFLEGGFAGMMLWPVPLLATNMYGTWTGVFAARPAHRRAHALLLVVTCAGGAWLQHLCNAHHPGSELPAGSGTCLGWLLGLLIISAAHGQPLHALRLAFMLLILCVALVTWARWRLGLWRETALVLVGMGAVQVRTDWPWRSRCLLVVMELAAVAGLFALDSADRQRVEMRQFKHCQ